MPLRIRGHINYSKQEARLEPALTRLEESLARQPWTAEHDATVRSIYPTQGPAPLVPVLRRTRDAISNRAGVLGVRYEPRFVWNDERDALLRSLWKKEKPAALAKKIGVSVGGLYARVQKLRLPITTKFSKRWDARTFDSGVMTAAE
jgi:hypothetical protein